MISSRPHTTVLSPKWHWTTDSLGRILTLSEQFNDSTGISPDMLIGKTFSDLTTPIFDLSGVNSKNLKRFDNKFDKRQSFRKIKLPIGSPDGGFRLIQINGKPEFGPRNKFVGYSGTGVDVTQEVENAANLAATYLPYADVLEGLGNGFAIWGHQGQLLLYNERFKSIFLEASPLVKKGAQIAGLSHALKSKALVIEPNTSSKILEVDQRRGSNAIYERQLQFADGNWISISAHKIQDDLTATTITDITPFKNRETQAIQDAQRNAQMAVAISAMDSGVIITNPNMPENPIVFTNPSFVAPDHIKEESILGLPFARLFKSPQNKSAFKNLVKSMKRRETAHENIQIFNENMDESWFNLRLNPVLNEANQVSYFLGIQNDITAQVKADTDVEIRINQQSVVAELGRKALAGSDLRELFSQAINLIAETLEVPLVYVREQIPDSEEMIIRAALGIKERYIRNSQSVPTANSLIGRIFSTGRTEIYYRTEAEYKKQPPILGERGIRTSVGIRIAGREHPFGLLAVHTKDKRYFSPDDINFLETIAYVLGVAVERSQAEDALKESEYRFDLAVKGSNDGIWDWDIAHDRIYFSARWLAMLGLSHEEMERTNEAWIERVHEDDRATLRKAVLAHLKDETPYLTCEHRMLHDDGSYRWMLVRGLAVRNKEGQATRIAGSLSDISEAKRAESQLLKDALHDTLTQLPNRALFTDRLVQSLTRTNRNSSHLFAVMFLDFDRFKTINDSLGHSFGDQILIEISHRLKECTRDVDTVARLGGDEFAILLDDLDSENTAREVARRINDSLGQPFKLSGREIVSNASIGIAFSSIGYSHPEEIIRDADIAMYQAKTEGRARHIVFEKGMHVRAITQLELESDLRRAIEKKQFSLVYQPVINIRNEKLTGFEALIRWKKPGGKTIAPGDFIPLAEETKLIVPIGLWVIEEACRQINKWRQKYKDLEIPISVNVSPEQFKDPNFVKDIHNILTKAKLDGRFLKIEITESAIMENPHEVTNRLNQLRKMGIHLHVDDFGTGYSSLSHLHRFPINALKIDRSFVISMGDSLENREIVRTIIVLAHNLNISTVAEGVECQPDQEQLKKLDCDFAQGYFFSKPLSVKSATALITQQKNPVKRRKRIRAT